MSGFFVETFASIDVPHAVIFVAHNNCSQPWLC